MGCNPMTAKRKPEAIAQNGRWTRAAAHVQQQGQMRALINSLFCGPKAPPGRDESRLFLEQPKVVNKKCRSEYTKWPGHPRSS